MGIEGLPLGGVAVDVLFLADASNRAIGALGGGRFLLTGQEFNSLVVTLATVMDYIADPVASQKNGGARYVEDQFYGPKAVFGDFNGKDIAVVGVFDSPKDGDAKIWWQALAEVLVRLGASQVTEGTVDQPAGAPTIVEVVGVATRAAVPADELTPKSMLRVNDKLAPILVKCFLGGGTFAARMVSVSRGTTTAAVPNETANRPTAVAMSELWEKNAKKGYGIAVAVTGGLVVASGVGALVSKMR